MANGSGLERSCVLLRNWLMPMKWLMVQHRIIGYNADGTPIINGASGYSETGFGGNGWAKHYPAGV